MDKSARGKYIISIAKSLKRFQLGDPTIAALLYAASYAGRAGLFASTIRHSSDLSLERLSALAAEEGFSRPELLSTLIPWMETAGLVNVKRQAGKITSVDSVVLSYSGLLEKISDLHQSLDPQPEDVGCIIVLHICTQLPRTQTEVLHAVAKEIGDEKSKDCESLVKNYKIVSIRMGKGLKEPIFYSEKVWSKNIDKSSKALVFLDNAKRSIVLDFVEQVRKYQGMPEALLRTQAVASNAEPMLDLAIGVGLVNKTEIQMIDGAKRAFLTSPHFFSDLEEEFGGDTCDRVKIFLDSIRNGQHFGYHGTGKIGNPDALLRKLINTRVIGPCTAIGTDWVTSERAGIVKVRREDTKSGKCYMELIQEDTVSKVHSIITTGAIGSTSLVMEAAHIREGSRFHSIEHVRAEVGELPAGIAEAERAIILKLRES